MALHRRPGRTEPYQDYRASLQARWRPFILERDGGRCRLCRARADLDMAHITDAVAFVRAAGSRHGVTFSYRWDNLYTLCRECHQASHRLRPGDAAERQREVFDLEAGLRRLRGWSSPFAVLPPSMVPARLRPRRSFHDLLRLTPLVPFPTFAKYAADGGLVWSDEEQAPNQQRLGDG